MMARSGLACALMCEADGEHLHQGLLQRPSHFCVHVRDANGQRLRKGGDRLRVTARGPGQLRPSVTDCGNGRYDVSYLATLSGSYQLAITCNNVPVRGSPFSVLIEPGCAHAPSCTIDAADLAEVVAGERARFTVRAYDESGRPKIMGGETFEALLVRRRSERSERSEALPPPSGLGSEAWEDEARAVIRAARSCEDEASWVDEALAEEARWLAAGSGDGRATSPPPSPGRRGAPLSISSNLALSPTLLRASEVRGGGVAAAAQAAQVAARRTAAVHTAGLAVCLRDGGNGSYSGAFSVTRGGRYLLHVRREGIPIKGSPVRVTLRPAPSFGPLCELRGEGARLAMAGRRGGFVLEPRDRFGNSRIDEPEDMVP